MNPVGLVPSPAGVDAAVALVELDQLSGRFVKAMKYANHRDALRPFAAAMAGSVGWRPDAVTWVPTTRGRKRRRGYDQAELLAFEMEEGTLRDHGGPDALRLFAAIIRATNADTMGPVGNA